MGLIKIDSVLSQIYFDPQNASSYSSAIRLYREAKKRIKGLRLSQVKDWLTKNETFTKFARVRKRFPKNKWIVAGLDSCHHADLAIFHDLRRYNDGYSYCLIVVDVFSRYLWVEPMKGKDAPHTAECYVRLVERTQRLPSRLVTDQGRFFVMT